MQMMILWLISLVGLFTTLMLQLTFPTTMHENRKWFYVLYVGALIILVFCAGMHYLDDEFLEMFNALLVAIPWGVLTGFSVTPVPANTASNVYSRRTGDVVGALYEGWNIVLYGTYEVRVSPRSAIGSVIATKKVTFSEKKTPPMLTDDKGILVTYVYSGAFELISGANNLLKLEQFEGGPDAAYERAHALIVRVFKDMSGKMKALKIDDMCRTNAFNTEFKTRLSSLLVGEDIPFDLVAFSVEDTELPAEVYKAMQTQYLQILAEQGKDELASKLAKRAKKYGIKLDTKEGVEAAKILSGDLKLEKTITEHRYDAAPDVIKLALDIVKELKK